MGVFSQGAVKTLNHICGVDNRIYAPILASSSKVCPSLFLFFIHV